MRRRAAMLIIAVAALGTRAAMVPPGIDAHPSDAPDMVVLAPHAFLYTAAGQFTEGSRPAAAPAQEVRPPHALVIMRREVTAGEYRRCVADGACPDLPGLADDGRLPAAPVSWRDASAYAVWLSHRLGVTYRLPTDEEWVFAAGSRFTPVTPARGNNPAAIALAEYERETALAAVADDRQGANENGLLDLAGTVAEWTDSCYRHVELDAAGASVVNCGIRIVEGRHRAYMPEFIRNPRAGGCSMGVPPGRLGFRLVREEGGRLDGPSAVVRAYLFFVAS